MFATSSNQNDWRPSSMNQCMTNQWISSSANTYSIALIKTDPSTHESFYKVDDFEFSLCDGVLSTEDGFLMSLVTQLNFDKLSGEKLLYAFTKGYGKLLNVDSPTWDGQDVFIEENDNHDLKFTDRVKFTDIGANEVILLQIMMFLPGQQVAKMRRCNKLMNQIIRECDNQIFGNICLKEWGRYMVDMQEYKSYVEMWLDRNSANMYICYMKISIGGQIQREPLVFQLSKETPKTSLNFISLCRGFIGPDGKILTYKDCILHRVIPQFMVQGGDFTNGNGTGGISIYGAKFNDENFLIKHTKRGQLSMCNAGPNTNGSQFFITSVACPWLDGKHTIFGDLIEGESTLQAIEAVGSQNGAVSSSNKVLIVDCGVGWGK